MPDPNFILLYVANPAASASFYAALLGRPPVESSPNFVLFVLASGLKLGLWSLHDVKPAAAHTGGGCELAFTVADEAAVRGTHAEWAGMGLTIAQTPAQMDFGFTFTALDPDGHRLRVFSPG
jgi:catechol 2,3-dioxygenase-like lactoylglutathione lyase family enzyme